ncbi:MAG TPA: hypothetical protein VKV02_03085 [Acidobacteriaceae bacterium]|nr:hypothetical protein [Acidobacteriaceae bacterium]
MTVDRKRWTLTAFYALATIQVAWCYLWLTRPYVNTLLYERGQERMPFQGRALMMLPMRLAHSSSALRLTGKLFAVSHFWFPRPVQPEVLVQALVNVGCLAVTGLLTTRMYQASSRHRLLTPMVYPLVLAAFVATYILHTVQNFRFLYDLPSLAFFTTALYLLYLRKPVGWFVALFLVATVNRETTLLLLPLYLLDHSLQSGRLQWRRALRPQHLAVVLPLALFWVGWEVFIRHHFAGNRSEFYPRLNWNVKSLLLPHAWPQLLSACGYLLPFVLLLRNRIPSRRLRAWLWLFPLWLLFMFSYGILIETRVFGELIPLVVCASTLIFEELLLARLRRSGILPRAARAPELPKLSRAA